jgi:hypothetical protein
MLISFCNCSNVNPFSYEVKDETHYGLGIGIAKRIVPRKVTTGFPGFLSYSPAARRLQPSSGVQRIRTVLVCLLPVLIAACTGSPSGPSETAPDKLLPGYALSAIDAAPAAGVTVQIGTAKPVTTDNSGYFSAAVSAPGTYDATISANTIVERHTTVSVPTVDPARFSLIPASFDLTAFDQMFRTSYDRLQRWTTRPSLVILASVMALRGGSGGLYSATSEQLSDDEVAEIIAHHTEGLALLTGGTYTSFAEVDVERPASGDRVNVLRPGSIVVGRYTGVVSFASTIGFGQWAEETDGSISGGATFLDRDFDRSDSRRRLLRIHELGHALGYQHVTVRQSIMNPAIGPEPTEFDRAGAIIAFQRSPGNRSPDVDPGASISSNTSSGPKGGLRWVSPVL